jgi:cell division control protein 6
LVELENSGLLVSQTASKGRHGYGTQYRLTVPLEMVGSACFADWWKGLVQRKKEHEKAKADLRLSRRHSKSSVFDGKPLLSGLYDMVESETAERWKDFVGLE